VADPIPTPRDKAQLPVEVIGSDLEGQQFFKRTRTVTIHRNGVTVSLENKLAPDAEMIVRNPETNEEAIALVLGRIREDFGDNLYGLIFVDSSVNLWHTVFPAAGVSSRARLECPGCQSVRDLSLSDLELEMFETTRELRRACKTCRSTRTWRETTRDETPRGPGEHPEERSNHGASGAPRVERRKSRRMTMETSACIRYVGREIIVDCENISKGGFRFTSRERYSEGTRLEAAVPYTKFTTNIFSPAFIVYSLKMPGGRYRHGVTYTKPGESTEWER